VLCDCLGIWNKIWSWVIYTSNNACRFGVTFQGAFPDEHLNLVQFEVYYLTFYRLSTLLGSHILVQFFSLNCRSPSLCYVYVSFTNPKYCAKLKPVATALKDKLYIPTRIFMAVLLLQFTACIITSMLECRPISFSWDKNQPGTCINLTVFIYCKQDYYINHFCLGLIC
jgi:hypothetical protein